MVACQQAGVYKTAVSMIENMIFQIKKKYKAFASLVGESEIPIIWIAIIRLICIEDLLSKELSKMRLQKEGVVLM